MREAGGTCVGLFAKRTIDVYAAMGTRVKMLPGVFHQFIDLKWHMLKTGVR